MLYGLVSIKVLEAYVASGLTSILYSVIFVTNTL